MKFKLKDKEVTVNPATLRQIHDKLPDVFEKNCGKVVNQPPVFRLKSDDLIIELIPIVFLTMPCAGGWVRG